MTDFVNAVFAASGWDNETAVQIKDNCKEAGVPLMAEMLLAVLDRGTETDLSKAAIRMSLDSDAIWDFWFAVVGPALDRLEQALFDDFDEEN